MNWKLFFNSAAKSVFSWKVIAKELVGIIMSWCAYFMASSVLTDPAMLDAIPSWTSNLPNVLFWPTVVVSGLSFVSASFKSALPAALALTAFLPLLLIGIDKVAYSALFLAIVSVVIYAIGFVFHGGHIDEVVVR